MRVAKRYIAKVERTLHTIDTIHIVAESENDAMEIIRDGKGEIVRTEIQEEKVDRRWIDSSVPLTTDEFMEVNDG
jgi:DNA-binding protein YbaB